MSSVRSNADIEVLNLSPKREKNLFALPLSQSQYV